MILTFLFAATTEDGNDNATVIDVDNITSNDTNNSTAPTEYNDATVALNADNNAVDAADKKDDNVIAIDGNADANDVNAADNGGNDDNIAEDARANVAANANNAPLDRPFLMAVL
ncbi:hypothetical protein O3M35_003902 [Rhynocoris fuscipes]|uniref:Circumsporozoite protein n=1 Tax=Rhynocoris fuscipes TaxID=488301 RepID=A0AAW1CGT2_9HEMI